MALTISGGDLGYYASSRFCRRCAWVRLHVKPLPYQSFPGIFSSIDRYNKLVVNSYFERHGSLPSWLGGLGKVEASINPPHWSAYSILDADSGVTLRGEADAIFKMTDGSYTIVDYKTSRYTPYQERLFPLYEAQLNAYALIGEQCGLEPVTGLALIYTEPATSDDDAAGEGVHRDDGFAMGFVANVVPVELNTSIIGPLLVRVRDILDSDISPFGRRNCRNCRLLKDLLDVAG